MSTATKARKQTSTRKKTMTGQDTLWSPKFIKDTTRKNKTAEPEVIETLDDLGVEKWTPEIEEAAQAAQDKGTEEALKAAASDTSHGPDASQPERFSNAPQMIEARQWLDHLLDNPPRYPDGSIGSIRVMVNKYRAAALLERNIDINRKRKPRLIADLREMAENNEWADSGQMIGFSTERLMINGQNRSEALATANVPDDKYFPLDLRFELPPESFHYMDTGAPRTLADSLSSGGEVSANALSAAARMMFRYNLPGESKMKRDARGFSPRRQREILKTHEYLREGVKLAVQFREGGLRSSAAAAVFWQLACSYNRRDAERFLYKFRTSVKIESEDDPIFKLRKYFSLLRGNRVLTADQMLSVMIKGFNAWIRFEHYSANPDQRPKKQSVRQQQRENPKIFKAYAGRNEGFPVIIPLGQPIPDEDEDADEAASETAPKGKK